MAGHHSRKDLNAASDSRRADAIAIWKAGVDAVLGRQLVARRVIVVENVLRLGQIEIDLAAVRRIAVVGAGKASAGMAAGLEDALGDELMASKELSGLVNVPADCVVPLKHIHLHAARPPGVNEPTVQGVGGCERILEIVSQLSTADICLCLLSGGGSALMPAPVAGVTLEDKLAITRHLSANGANIAELNTVRTALSRIKGGGLSRACRAGQLVSLVLSDVIGDPLETIASGPTVPRVTTAADALDVLERFSCGREVAPRVYGYLERADELPSSSEEGSNCEVHNLVIGNNQMAVAAAESEARRRGYRSLVLDSTPNEGTADEVGSRLADLATRLSADFGYDCLISGGEPVVQLVDESQRGKGGRNQQLVLSALARLNHVEADYTKLVFISGGTDGEDGPTDAAGGILDQSVADAAEDQGLIPKDFLRRNDAYSFFEKVEGLLKTGPTHTNVCDLRVVLTGN